MRLKLLLGEIDRRLHLSDHKGEDISIDYAKLTIEHVMPQAWREHWPLAADDPTALALAEQARERQVQHIGNLTLLTSALNPAVSNGAWEAKREGLEAHSILRLNQRIRTSDTWDEEVIKTRGAWLADQVAAIWPATAPAVNDDADEVATSASGPSHTPAVRLLDEDLHDVHLQLWAACADVLDSRGWRLHTSVDAALTSILGVDLEPDAGDELVREALGRLVGNGHAEVLSDAAEEGARPMWISPPDHAAEVPR